MGKYAVKTEKKSGLRKRCCPYPAVGAAFFLLEVFAFCYLQPGEANPENLWPLAFGLLWSVILGGLLYLLPRRGSRIAFGLLFAGGIVYTVGQTGYYQLFSQMMWLSDFRYASEGKDYLDILTQYPASWFIWILGLVALGGVLLWRYPQGVRSRKSRWTALALVLAAALGASQLPKLVFLQDGDIRYAKSDYGRMQSAQAVYENLFSAHRLYQICGVHHTITRDLTSNILSIGESMAQEEAGQAIDAYFEENRTTQSANEMTGILKDKNVILVLMESMDDWMLGEHTPTINQMMAEGIQFTNFYTPAYGGIRTFNTEFCINTGSFLSSQGGYAFDYVTNGYNQSLATLLRQQGYSAKTFHYNDPSFYSRGVFSLALGYEEYVYYADYLSQYSEKEQKQLLYDDSLLLKNEGLRQEFFREGKKLNFLITRSAHLSYKYNEVLSHWALKKYPQYKGLTGHEETDCALLKARLVDDLFRDLLTALEEEGQLENTVIIGVTDHYTYGYKDEQSLLELSQVDRKLLLEKTPCFIWGAGVPAMEVDKTLNTSDLLPTVLNLLGVDSGYDYIGRDAFDETYPGFAIFSDGSWIAAGDAYDASTKEYLDLDQDGAATAAFKLEMADKAAAFVQINNLILDADYYSKALPGQNG